MRISQKLSLIAVLAVVAPIGASSASAETLSPWWHVTVGARPTNLHAGVATSQVQELTVNATKGDVIIENPENEAFAVLPYNASLAELQQDVQTKIYPTQKALVTGTPGDYIITFPPGHSAPLMSAFPDSVEGAPFFGGEPLEGEANIKWISEESKPDGDIVVTAVNLGDASIDGESSRVSLADVLPPGLEAVSIGGKEEDANNFAGVHPPVACALQSLSCTYSNAMPPIGQIEVNIGVVVKPGAVSGEVNRASVSGGEGLGCEKLPQHYGKFKNVLCTEGSEGGAGAYEQVSTGPVSSATRSRAVTISGAPTPFGVEEYDLSAEEAGGAPDTQAGSHPFQFTTTLSLNQHIDKYDYHTEHGEEYFPELPAPAELSKDLSFNLPPGMLGDPTPFPQCTMHQFLETKNNQVDGNECSPQTAVGTAVITTSVPTAFGPVFGIHTFVVPIFNIEPAVGEPARFGFIVDETFPVLLDTSVRTGGDYGVTVHVNNITQEAGFISNVVTFWGVPGDPRHNDQRGWGCLEEASRSKPPVPCGSVEESQTPPPLLILPTACTGPLQSTVEADSWTAPGAFRSFPANEPMQAMDGCNRLPFSPSIKVTPDGQAASTPTGLTVDEHVPQQSDLSPTGLSESAVKGLSVTLPAGVGLNPAGADGLQACSLEQIGLQSPEAPACPEAAKVATVKIKTPLLPNALEGAAYLATQNANPFGSLIALYVYAEDPTSGVRAKATGEVLENPVTGQLTAHFEGDPVFEHDPAFAGDPQAQFLPEVPFEDVELHFFGGDRAPLATPQLCGSYTTTGTFTPWTEAGTTESASTFGITSGPNGGPCTYPGHALPFSPSLTGGATNVNAGVFSPFTATMSRKDGEQNLQSLEVHLPPGLSGILTGVELCPEPQANLGECGPNSLIGETTVSVGVGGDPFSVSGGKFYLTGPYNGSGGCTVHPPGGTQSSSDCAPFGITFEVPAKAGPFDLERNSANPAGEDPCDCVIVRGKIEINPLTSAITITSNPPGTPDAIPTSIEGIPLEIQHVNAITTRNNFQFNPTNCNKMEVTGTIHSSEGGIDKIGVPFQVTNCGDLKFTPKFAVSTNAKTSKANGASLTAKVTEPAGSLGTQANLARVKVELPRQLPSRLTTLQKACTAAQFEANPANCPSESKIGYAKVITPLVPVPLEGPAIFVSHGGEAFPSLTMVLQGYGVTIDLVGATFISKAGITSTTFKTVPDQPFSSFTLTLPTGKYSALTALGNVCKLTTTKTVSKKVTTKVKGHRKTVTRKVKQTVASSLVMPTEFVAQNGTVLKQDTKIAVTGCKASKPKSKKKAKGSKAKANHGKGRK